LKLDINEEAKLLLSVGTHRRKRPLGPVEVSDLIYRLEKFGGATICGLGTPRSQIASKLGFKGKEMLERFLSLQTLPVTIRGIIGWEGAKDGRLTLSTGWELVKLRDEKDKEILAKVALDRNLAKREVVSIVQLRLRNPQKTINECIEDVKRIRPEIQTGYAVVTQLTTDTISKLRECAARSGSSLEDALKAILSKSIPSAHTKSVAIRKRLVILTLDEDGYKLFKTLPDKLKTSSEMTVETLVQAEIGGL